METEQSSKFFCGMWEQNDGDKLAQITLDIDELTTRGWTIIFETVGIAPKSDGKVYLSYFARLEPSGNAIRSWFIYKRMMPNNLNEDQTLNILVAKGWEIVFEYSSTHWNNSTPQALPLFVYFARLAQP